MIPYLNFRISGIKLFLLALSGCFLLTTMASARKLTHESGKLKLTLHAPLGDMLAVNEAMSGQLDTKTGTLSYQVSVSGFRFITEHMPDAINGKSTRRFNDYYLETSKFPDAVFQGKIVDLNKVNFEKEGVYKVLVQGVMTIHGEHKSLEDQATIEVKGKQVIFRADLTLKIADYRINVPEMVRNIFFKEVAISAECYLR